MDEYELLDSYKDLEKVQGKIIARGVFVAENYSRIYKTAVREGATETAEITRVCLIESRDQLNAYVAATSKTNNGIKLRLVSETIFSIDSLLRETEDIK